MAPRAFSMFTCAVTGPDHQVHTTWPICVHIYAKLFQNPYINVKDMDRINCFITFDPWVWPWPWTLPYNPCSLHSISGWGTFVSNYIKFLQLMKELFMNLTSYLITFDLDVWPPPLIYPNGPWLFLMMVKICAHTVISNSCN